jgi:EAL domain-containing protein (putative c-di-GMP-specific phosphodiesterase class I)
MYLAKHGGKNQYVIYDTTAAAKRRSLQQRLTLISTALDNKEFFLYFQPQVNMVQGSIIGMEALIRWQSPEHGVVLPSEFMPLVENSELATSVGCFVLRNAVAQIAEWHELGFNWRMCINISPRHLEHPNFIDDLKTVLNSYPNVAPDMIELEIVESAALEDIEKVIRIMKTVREIGVHFALDDFGTGHASLTYLRRLPVRTLKIDRSFVRDMLVAPSDLIMVEGISSLAHTFDHEVLAEGVDNLQLGALLVQIGCSLAQGFAISHPMPANMVVSWAQRWQPTIAWQQVGQRRWRRDDLPLLYAEQSHRTWVSQMQKLVDGETTNAPELDHQLCRFSRWQFGIGSERYGTYPEFADVIPLHEEVHKTGHRIIRHIEENMHQEASNEMHKLYELRDRLIAKMDLLAQKVTTTEH